VETLRGGSGDSGTSRSPARFIGRRCADYPERLTHLHRPPVGVWVRGPVAIASDRMIGIVGTRRATEYGRRMAHRLAFDLAGLGWTIVSGLARGIDAAAHRGALASGGETIAVLGCGVHRVYPRSNRDLFAEVAERGLLVSEYPPDTRPAKFNFPQRNRIIAALSRAVVVVQAGPRSGALITAGLALELGREVLAVPGPVDQSVSRGVHQLLRDGAAVAESAGDVLRQLGEPEVAGAEEPQGSLFDGDRPASGAGTAEPADRLRAGLSTGPAAVEDLARAADLAVPEALATLCRMELGGVVRSLPGYRFELVRRC